MIPLSSFSEAEFLETAKAEGVTHISTGIAVVRGDTVLLVRRIPDDFLGGNWELPGGGVDPGETIIDGARRELREETGLEVTKVLGVLIDGTFDYEMPPRKPHVRQINFLVLVSDRDVKLEPEEHDAAIWVTIDNYHSYTANDSVMDTCVKAAFDALATLK